ncbi:MAG TPA: DUF3857 domain-containing protein [Candidatus Sulfotelmatobacter sp.]
MSLGRRLAPCFFSAILLLAANTMSHAGTGFQSVNPEELKMTSEPQAPGAPAIILYRQVDRNDYGLTGHGGAVYVGSQSSQSRLEDNYLRIKILTEAGRKYANVEIPLPREVGSIDTINARTIRPDGSIVNFSGQVFEKSIYKARGINYVAKTFTLSDVQVGSIIEYYYTVSFAEGRLYGSRWVLSDELFTKKAKFSLKPAQNDIVPLNFRWTEKLPPGTESPKRDPSGIIRLEAANIAAFQAEDFMPPEDELRARVDFIYSYDEFEMDATKFWRKVGKKRNDELEHFLGKRGALEPVVAQIVAPNDTAEVKLQKLYARVQQLHNTSYEVAKTEQEQKRENIRTEVNVEDVWKRGSGDSRQLTWLYLALVRAAGFEAYGVLAPDRRTNFFQPQTMDSFRLGTSVVLVKLNGKDLYFEPGAQFTPYGLLPWQETGVQGLRLDKDGGGFVQTALPESSASRIERKADLKMSNDGSLEGKLIVTFTGLEALRRRVDERHEDDAARKKFLEGQVKEYIPAAVEVELTNQPEWSSSSPQLVAEYRLTVPGWASVAGHRALFPVGVFSAPERQMFEHAERVHPVYFEYLSQKVDDIIVDLPPGWQVSSLPKPVNQDLHVVGYSCAAENNKGALHLTRKLDISIILLDTKYYGPLRSFFQGLRANDEQQVVLQPGTTATSN